MSTTNWGSVIVDLALLAAAVYTSYYVTLLLCFFTGSYLCKRS